MSDSNSQFPLFSLWYKPKRTLQGLILDGRGHAAAIVIALLFGGVQGWRFYVSTEPSSPGVLIAGGLVLLLGLYLYGWLIRNFGRWFQSEAKQSDIRTALGWGLLPWTVMFGALSILMARAEDATQLAGLYPVFFVGFIYGYVVLLLALSAALRISILKTFLCLVITCLVSIFPLTLLAQILIGPVGPTP